MMRIILSGLVWAVYDGEHLVTPARLDEESFLVDADDRIVDLKDHRIGIAHRLDLDEETANTWSHMLSDYDLAPPFPQLDRPVKASTELPETPISAEPLVTALEARGWELWRSDSRVHDLHIWPIPTYDTAVVLHHSEIPYLTSQHDVTLFRLEAVAGVPGYADFDDDGNLTRHETIPWSRVSSRLLNEVLITIDGWGSP